MLGLLPPCQSSGQSDAVPSIVPTLPVKTSLDLADEQTEQFLIQYGLHRLLAEHLERRLGLGGQTPAGGASARKTEIADRLAETYALILNDTDDPAEQSRVEARARVLLSAVPEADSVELRLGLARAGYTRLEQIAERRRILSAGPAEALAAARRLSELAQQFDRIASEANERVLALERQEASSKSDENLVAAALAGVRRQRSMAHYLAGWCTYYACELGTDGVDPSACVAPAIRHFSWLLGAARPGTDTPRPDQVPADLLRYEHVARSVIAVGLCLSLARRYDEAERWLDAAEAAPDVPESLKSQVFARRLVVLARGQRWEAMRTLVDARRAPPTPEPGKPAGTPASLSVPEARLLAALALSADPATGLTRALSDVGVSDLLAAGEPGAVLELAAATGIDRFASTGFVAHQVRALQLYDRAKQAQSSAGNPAGEPATDREAVRLFQEAAEQFRLALESPDRSGFAGALASTRMLLGLCWYAAAGPPGNRLPGAPPDIQPIGDPSALVKSAEWFDSAASAFTDPLRRSDALWMAIRALDLQLTRAPIPDRASSARRDDLIDRYIKEFPDGERTSALVLRRSQARARATPEEVARLLSVPESDPAYLASRRQAARMAYELFRAVPAGQSRRDALGMRYVEVAEPLLALERRRAASDALAASNAAAHARQILDVLLGSTAPDADRAERVMDVLTSLIDSGTVDPGPIQAEMMLRRMQLALARGQDGTAVSILEQLRAKDQRLADVGDRLVVAAQVRAFRGLKSALDRGDESARVGATDAARAALATARRLIKRESESGTRLSDASSLALSTSAAEIAAFLWTTTGDAEARDLALALYRVLSRRQPDVRPLLRGLAQMAFDARKFEESAEAWATLASGAEPGTAAWFEARCRLMEATSETAPDKARDLFRQHAALYPMLAPAPWGERLKALGVRLGVSP